MSTYEKCMGFPINFPQYGKIQQDQWYGESLGNRYSYFSYSMDAFFPSDNYPVVYFSIWGMYGFPRKFPEIRENATKPVVWGKSGKLIIILFPIVWVLFSHLIPILWYIQHMGNAWVSPYIFLSTEKYNKTHGMEKVWEIDSYTFPIVWVLFSH